MVHIFCAIYFPFLLFPFPFSCFFILFLTASFFIFIPQHHSPPLAIVFCEIYNPASGHLKLSFRSVFCSCSLSNELHLSLKNCTLTSEWPQMTSQWPLKSQNWVCLAHWARVQLFSWLFSLSYAVNYIFLSWLSCLCIELHWSLKKFALWPENDLRVCLVLYIELESFFFSFVRQL